MPGEADLAKGASGSICDAFPIILMDINGKDEQAGLTPDQKKALKGLADRYKRPPLGRREFSKRKTL